MTEAGDDDASRFAAIVEVLRSLTPRGELQLSEITPPEGFAPWSYAVAGDVRPSQHGGDSVLGTGRFIVFYDPSEPEPWNGEFRVVCYAQAPLEADIGMDPFVADVAWSWLTEALAEHGAAYVEPSGTATTAISTGYGELAGRQKGAELELRASWTPSDDELAPHLAAWADLLCMLAGLPPRSEGVTVMSAHRAGRG